MKVDKLRQQKILKMSSDKYSVAKNTDCWEWSGVINAYGYGRITLQIDEKARNFAPHRLSYQQNVGPIPTGMQIDHLCRNRKCINPKHLQVVTQKENILRGQGITAQNARKTHCHRGHAFDAKNTYTHHTSVRGHPRLKRHCLACFKARRNRINQAKI